MTFVVGLVIRGDGTDADAALKKTGAAVKQLGDETDKAGRKTTAAGAAQKKAAGDAEALARANRTAAASFTGLNTAAVTSETGLRSALRQGARIDQVLGPAGAGGALKSLGVGLLAVANPINFIAAASITAEAALIGWLSGAADAALPLEERIDSLKDAIKDLRDGTARSLTDMAADFGRVTPAILAMERAASGLRLEQVLLDASSAAKGLKADLEGKWGSYAGAVDDLLGASSKRGSITARDTTALTKSLEGLAEAKGLDAQLAAAKALRETFAGITGGIQAMTVEQLGFYGQIVATETALRSAAAASAAVPTGLDLAQGFASALQADLTAAWNAANGVAGANMAGPISAAANAAAGLAGFLQAAAAAAWSAAQGRMAAEQQLTQIAFGNSPGGRALTQYGSRGPGQTPEQRALEVRNTPPKIAGGGSAGGGGGAAARAEADAVGELIARLRGEIEVARETDPVQRELLELRKELTGATAAQRAEVENLIRSRHAEAEAMETLNYVSEQMGDALVDALMGADGAGKQLIQTLLRAVAQAALLGTGPLAPLFGGKGLFGSTPGGGGILGAIVGSIFTKKAGGGWIDGPGGPTDDRIPALVSNGEFIVRASAAARNRAALEAINGGFVPRFAQGGFVGGGSGGGGGGAANAGGGTVRIELGEGLVARILDQAQAGSIEITRAGIAEFDRQALPARVGQISRDPRRKG